MSTSTADGSVTVATTALTSTTVPVSLIPPSGPRWSWIIKNRQASANSVLVFPYTGTLSGTAPADAYELAAGAFINNNLLGDITDQGISVGWAAVLLTAGTATVDAVWS